MKVRFAPRIDILAQKATNLEAGEAKLFSDIFDEKYEKCQKSKISNFRPKFELHALGLRFGAF